MADPMKPEFTGANPIVEAASRIRARREVESAIGGEHEGTQGKPEDAEESFAALHKRLLEGAKRLNSIVGKTGR